MRFALILSFTALSACASSSTIGTGRSTETVRGSVAGAGMSIVPSSSENVTKLASPLEQVWRVLPAVYESLGIPLTTIDQKSHTIGNEGFKTRKQLGTVALSKYIECGTTQIGPNADSYEVHISILTQLEPAADGTTKLTTTFEAASRPLAFAQEYARCSSKGVLEPKLVAAVTAKLQPK
jgi:hypothetical protein